MKQTAVEWFAEQFEQSYSYINELFKETIEQAKEMEKEQIEDAFVAGTNSEDYFFPSLGLTESEVYYNETYKKDIK
jgi:N-acetylglutamate synthase-like GNAT family acetyltransferase